MLFLITLKQILGGGISKLNEEVFNKQSLRTSGINKTYIDSIDLSMLFLRLKKATTKDCRVNTNPNSTTMKLGIFHLSNFTYCPYKVVKNIQVQPPTFFNKCTIYNNSTTTRDTNTIYTDPSYMINGSTTNLTIFNQWKCLINVYLQNSKICLEIQTQFQKYK
ncbi:hypothetical protein ACTFIR_011927 [Dictyostelium discoideum]